MAKLKYDLLSDKETADILGINLEKLYNYCAKFDEQADDEWELIEGEHFQWETKTPSHTRKRLFYEEGAMALAKYMQEEVASRPLLNFCDQIIEKLTNRRKRTRKNLVRRRLTSECNSSQGVEVRRNKLFLARPKVIRILDTNGKGINAAAKREQANASLNGRAPLQIGEDFDDIDGVQYWSQSGIARIATNMSENLGKKHRRAWTEAVAEVAEEVLEEYRKRLESFDSRVQKAMNKVKNAARGKCQVSLEKQSPANQFNLAAHHLFDKKNHPHIADYPQNLLVMREEIHDGFHNHHGRSNGCEPKDFITYITTIESWRFESPEMNQHLNQLIIRLETLQSTFGKNR